MSEVFFFVVYAPVLFFSGYALGLRESARILNAIHSLESRIDVLKARIEAGNE